MYTWLRVAVWAAPADAAVSAAVTVWYAAVFAYAVAAVTIWNAVSADVVVLAAAASAAVTLPSLTCGVVAAHFAVEP